MAGKTGAKVKSKGGGKKTVKSTPAKAKSAGKTAKKAKSGDKKARKVKVRYDDPALFAPLTEGERADALRTLTEDKRLASMAKVGRYRVIAIEPFPTKPPHPLAGHRLVRVVAYDYSADRSVEASVDLDHGAVAALSLSRSQPMLAIEEEDMAIAVAVADSEVKDKLALGEVPLSAMHYWSWRETDLAFSRRSAAVLFGPPGGRPSWVVVVDLLDGRVSEVVPGQYW